MKQRTAQEMREYQRQRRAGVTKAGVTSPGVTDPNVMQDGSCLCKRWGLDECGNQIEHYIPPHKVSEHEKLNPKSPFNLEVKVLKVEAKFPEVAKPEEATAAEWANAVVRAERARGYARKFPEHVCPGDAKYSDPSWQWGNNTKGRL